MNVFVIIDDNWNRAELKLEKVRDYCSSGLGVVFERFQIPWMIEHSNEDLIRDNKEEYHPPSWTLTT